MGLVALRSTRSHQRADEWALVLTAVGLSPSVRPQDGAFVVSLPPEQVEAASEALAAYERENPAPVATQPTPARETRRSRAGTLAAAALLVFFFLTGPHVPGNRWFEAGRADAERIRAGELRRVATALTLHADLAHVAANAVMGALLVNVVCGGLGNGVGLAAVLLAGMGGNALNAAVHASSHSSVGASTAVFGALGLLCGQPLSWRRRSGTRGWRLLAPLGAGLGVIAMLGVGGGRTDIWAHLFGFGAGVGLGFGLARVDSGRLGRGVQLRIGVLALAVMLACWSFALF